VRLEQFRRVKALHQAGLDLSRTVDETGLGWRTAAKWVTLDILPERRLMDPRPSNPVSFQDFFARLWDAGCTNGRKLLIEVQEQGYTGSFSHLERLLRKWRCTGAAAAPVQEPDTVALPAVTAIPNVRPIVASILCMKPRGQGRIGWQRRSGYNRRSLVETAMYRYKTIIGRRLLARTLSSQQIEAKVGCNVLNRMTSFGMPATVRIG